MASAVVQRVVREMRSAAVRFECADVSDAQLLDRFLSARDEAAFATLLRRHGAMVLGVCRRVLGNVHDAEDAFQATFLVLVKKAASVRPRDRVGHWLHGVAYRTALEARTMAARRRRKEQSVLPPTRTQMDAWDEVRPVLDRELARLPENYRRAVVLCDLEGKTRKEAARQLGWPEGTVAGRLARARRLLAQRLTRQGIVLSAAVLAERLPRDATAALSASLARSTVQSAMGVAAGKAAAAGSVPAHVAALMEGVMKAMLFAKLRAAFGTAALVAVVGVLVSLGSYGAVTAEAQSKNEAVRSREEKPATKVDSSAARLPAGAPPIQALVSLAGDNTLVVRTAHTAVEPVTTFDADHHRATTSYRAVRVVRSEAFDLATVVVRDTHGKKVTRRDVVERLKTEIPALVQWGNQVVDPLHLVLIKEGTLIFTLPPRPAPTSPPPPDGPLPTVPARPVPAAPIVPNPPTEPPPAPGAPPPPTPLSPPGLADPRTLLKQARALYEQGKLAEAEKLAADAADAAAAPTARWGLFEDSPDRLRRDIQHARTPPIPPRPSEPAVPLRTAPTAPEAELWSGTRNLHVPLNVRSSPGQKIARVRLLASTDRGKSWKVIAEVSPETEAISYNAPGDGLYWFAAEVECTQKTTTRLPAHLKVRVRTPAPAELTPPAEESRSLPPDRGPQDVIEHSSRQFRIPIRIVPQERHRITKVRLLVSADQGKSWAMAAEATPDIMDFQYHAPRDGLYWFALQTDMREQPATPADRAIVPSLKIRVHAPTTP